MSMAVSIRAHHPEHLEHVIVDSEHLDSLLVIPAPRARGRRSASPSRGVRIKASERASARGEPPPPGGGARAALMPREHGGRIGRPSEQESLEPRVRPVGHASAAHGVGPSPALPILALCSAASRTLRAAARRQRCSAGLRRLRILDPACARRCEVGAFAKGAGGQGNDDGTVGFTARWSRYFGGCGRWSRQIDGPRQGSGATTSAGVEQRGARTWPRRAGSSGGTRRERYRNALGSARETGACIDVAMACGYVEALDEWLLDGLDKVRATLVKVVR